MSRASLKAARGKPPARRTPPRAAAARPVVVVAGEPKRQRDTIDAAARVFALKGFHGASTQDIADVLGIRQASLYYYFRSKEEALRIVCERGASGFHERALGILAGSGTSREKLGALIAAHLEPLQDRADYVRVFLRERQHLPASARKTITAHARGVEKCFETVIADGVRHGAFSPAHDPRLAALAILAMVNAVPFWRESKGNALTPAAREIAQIALGGLTGIAWYDIPATGKR